MKALEKIEWYEDNAVAILVTYPEMLTKVPFDISIFTKWKRVVDVIVKQSNSGIRPDVLTITEQFPDDNDLLFTLAMLNKNCPSNANYEYYIRGLTELCVNVRIYKKMQAAMKQIADGDPVREVFGGVVNDTLSMMSGNIPKFSYSATEISAIGLERIEKNYEDRETAHGKAFSGINKLDSVVGGFFDTNLVVIGARPSAGKTAIGVTMMLNMAREGKRVGFISSEMSVGEMSERMLSQQSQVPAWRIRKNMLSGDDWSRLSKASAEINKLNINLCDKPGTNIAEVAMQARVWGMAGGLDVLVVDYLTRIKPEKPSGNQNLDVGEVVTQMKNIARMLNIAVIVLAQLNRGSALRGDKRPTMADLRDSGIIEQEADCILLLHREQMDGAPDKNIIIVDKNRHGEAGLDLLVDFDADFMRWR